jgi:hypothetical protein
MEIFQLFVPYHANKNEINASSAAVLLELRQKVKNKVNNLNLQLDSDFNEALKSPVQRQNERTLSVQKQHRKNLKRGL